ncbi:MAG: RluA family pseudouridine synthase [Candidatus Goldbacteria bacterium]|nr:RluA family pseudouridine synthase [Candidatus Goldiibacteriota bacterium]
MDIKNITIYEDDNIIALNKPSGMLVIPDRFDKEKKNLYSILKEKFKKIYIVHRIDKDTSGVILFAKNPEIHRELSMMWEKGKIKKIYYALVHGALTTKQGVINKPIASLKKKKGVMVIDYKNGKKSITEYKVIKKNTNYSLLEVTPKTGRTHQIRVHLASIGHPIAGDSLYNRKEATGVEKYEDNFPRLCLHAYKIRFFYSVAGKEIEITAPVYLEQSRFEIGD